MNPTVSILCCVYNHEAYLAKAIESFLNQKTNFHFEVILAEDFSTDRSREIICEFQKRFPQIIKPIFRDRNIGGQKNFVEGLKLARGKYVTLCDGDDFYEDNGKLQLQADFLDQHPDHTIVFHTTRWFFDDGSEKDSFYPNVDQLKSLSIEELLRWNFISTVSVMYRRINYSHYPTTDFLPGDWFCHLYHARFGRIGFIDRPMAAYRRHRRGLWWIAENNHDELIQRQSILLMRMYHELYMMFENQANDQKIILLHVRFLIKRMVDLDLKHGQKLLAECIQYFPDLINRAIASYIEGFEHGEELEYRVKTLSRELQEIYDSKRWRIASKLASIRELLSLGP